MWTGKIVHLSNQTRKLNVGLDANVFGRSVSSLVGLLAIGDFLLIVVFLLIPCSLLLPSFTTFTVLTWEG